MCFAVIRNVSVVAFASTSLTRSTRWTLARVLYIVSIISPTCRDGCILTFRLLQALQATATARLLGAGVGTASFDRLVGARGKSAG